VEPLPQPEIISEIQIRPMSRKREHVKTFFTFSSFVITCEQEKDIIHVFQTLFNGRVLGEVLIFHGFSARSCSYPVWRKLSAIVEEALAAR
jgi:hypothetical protein